MCVSKFISAGEGGYSLLMLEQTIFTLFFLLCNTLNLDHDYSLSPCCFFMLFLFVLIISQAIQWSHHRQQATGPPPYQKERLDTSLSLLKVLATSACGSASQQKTCGISNCIKCTEKSCHSLSPFVPTGLSQETRQAV